MITFDDFARLDLKIGKVLEAKVHPHAEKLLLLKVDIGGKTVQLVAGIKQFYSPQSLHGKLIVVVTNLESKDIRGEVSEGMLLAAQSKDRISVIGPYEEVPAGSKIR